ncbi:MAG: MBL fold metallo-hydrolase [Streptomycetales bacterium]
MLVRFVGSGDAFGSGGRFQTCIWMEAAGQSVLVDCGASSLVAMRQRGLEPSDVDAVLLTHLHGDHFGGVPFLLLEGQFSGRTRPLVIAGPPGVRERVTACMEVLFPGSSKVDRRFETRYVELPADLTPVAIGPASVSAIEVSHASGAPPLALRVRSGGRTLAYSGDTAWTDALVEVARGADLFVCEAYTFDRKIRYHLDYSTLREHLPRIEARHVMLTHLSADMLAHVPEVDLPVAADGLTLHL